MNINKTSLLVMTLVSLMLFGCGKKVEEEKKGPPPTIVTVAKAQIRPVEVLEETVGVVETEAAPLLSAEVSAKVDRVEVDVGDQVKVGQVLAVLDAKDLTNSLQIARAEVRRMEALLANQRKLTERNRQLAAQNFISPTKLDESISQQDALQAQLNGARAALSMAHSNLRKTKITAPVAGRVEQRFVSGGDYVTVGKPLFQLATSQNLRVRLPFPEGIADRIKQGMKVRLATPTAPGKTVEGTIQEIRTMVGSSNRAFEAIVEVTNPGDWKPGASVNAAVVVAEHPRAIVVPEASLVLRPAGKVVYIIDGGKAMERKVVIGERREGALEITAGLAAGEIVAVDGAGFLTNKALVKVQNEQPRGHSSEGTK